MASRISGKTQVIGLFGSPVSHSRSPIMQNSVFEAMGLDYVYVAFPVGLDQVADAVQAVRVLSLRGANVTMPLKRAITKHLGRLSAAAELAGAVNVIVNEDGELAGYLTDGEGFMLSLAEAGVDHVGRHMVILGAGGAGMAVAIQAAMEGVASVSLFNRRDDIFHEAAKTVAKMGERLDCSVSLTDLKEMDALEAALRSADILVNATPLGMEETSGDMALPDAGLLRPDLVVCDLIYVPRETRLLREAAQQGCKTVSGLGMQLHQAVPAFRMWTGRDMPVDLARQVLFEGAA